MPAITIYDTLQAKINDSKVISVADITEYVGRVGGQIKTLGGNFYDQRVINAAMILLTAEDKAATAAFRLHNGSLVLRPKVGMGATFYGWTDSHPYEIVRVVSDQTIDVRPMKSELSNGWKPEVIPGGFVGHCRNQDSQTWTITSDETAPVARIRLCKNGTWHGKLGTYGIGSARKYYDYNF